MANLVINFNIEEVISNQSLRLYNFACSHACAIYRIGKTSIFFPLENFTTIEYSYLSTFLTIQT